MALETVTIVLDQTWRLISNAGAGRFRASVLEGIDALFSIGTAAPDAGSLLGTPAKSLSFETLDGKVWARGAGIRAVLSVTRVVDAGNPVLTVLPDIGLSATTFSTTLAAGSDIATITGLIAGTVVESITPNDGRIVLSSDKTKLVRGMTEAAPGAIRVEIVTSHPLAANSPKRQTFTLGVTAPALAISGTPDAATVGKFYGFVPTVTGGYGAKSFSLTGSLPEGLSFSSSTGSITGHPRAAGAFNFGMTVSDVTGSASVTGKTITINPAAGGGGAMVLRGYNPGMTVSANAVRIGGANRSLACAITRKFPFTFRRFKVVQQVFSPVNRVDTLYDKSTKFAHAFAPAGRSGFTGIAPRTIKATWGGGDFLNYDTATWDANTGWSVSDTIDLGVETDTIDCWHVAVAPASITTPSSHFYAMETVADNLIQHGAGTFASTTDAIADGSWLTVNSLIAAPANAAGSNSFMSPAMYLIEVPGTTKCVVFFTDSHGVGLNSGAGATMVDSVQYGGPMGNDKLAMSWLDRGISELGIGYCRLGQGGDGDRYWGPNPNNWRFRKGLGILANPTHFGDESATNDMGVVGSQSNVDAGKTFVRGAALRHIGAGKVYICTQAGDINGQMPEGTSADVLGTEITSGTAKFTCTGTFTAALFNATAVLGVQMMVSDQIKAQWPSIPFIRCGLLPDAATTNNFADLAAQTPNAVYGQGTASKRGQYLQIQKSALGKALLRYDFAWYPEQFIENDPANYDSLIKPDATVPDKLMFASHLTSYGHHIARQAVTPQALA